MLTQTLHVRQAMPATTSSIYFNAGTFGPIPNCVTEAIQERMQEEWREGRLGANGFQRMGEIYAQARSRVAHLLNADETEIALTDNTGEGMNIICNGINWQKGDEVITTNHEHISALAPLYQLRDRFGINITVADLGPGAAIPMQKWLCGPDGTGALYIRKASLALVTPTYVGYYSILHEDDFVWAFQPGAQRFEMGGRQTAAIAGQAAALTWLETVVGYEWLHKRNAALNLYAYNALKDIPDLSILTPQPGTNGILALTIAGRDDSEIVQRLRTEYNILIRSIPDSHALRISTGFYNTEAEIDTLTQALTTLLNT